MKKVLFVCLGNICRSPTAEGIFKYLIEEKGLTDQICCDSAGITSVHSGEKADSRSAEHAKKRGIILGSRSRGFDKKTDFEKFDLILAMDRSNYRSLEHFDQKGVYKEKIKLMTEFCLDKNCEEVPDPYFSGEEGFEIVLDILEDATKGLLNFILKDFNES